MEKCKIEIADRRYSVEVARNEEDRIIGLQNRTKMGKFEGMLFIFDEVDTAQIWMKETLIPLDIIYINEYYEVIAVIKGQVESEEIHEVAETKYVLELNIDSGVKVGDDVDLSEVEPDVDEEEDDEEDSEVKETLHVVAPDGSTQMELAGGERIFSRPNTKTLVKLSKRAYKSKSEKDYKALGRKVFKYITTQNNKEDDFVEIPK